MKARRGTTASKAILLGVVVTTVALGAASLAWACTSQAVIGTPGSDPEGAGALDPSFGPSGTPVKVEGRLFREGPVQIRWNSYNGQLLQTAQGPNFSTTIVIPEASPGVYYVVAFQRNAAGNVAGNSRASFEVTKREATSSSAGQGGSGSASGSASGEDSSLSSGSGQTSGTASGGDSLSSDTAGGQTSGSASGARRETAGQTSGSASGALSRGTTFPDQSQPTSNRSSSGSSAAVGGEARKQADGLLSGTHGRSSDTAASNSAEVAPRERVGRSFGMAHPETGSGAANSGPSTTSVMGDLWKGFDEPPLLRSLTDPASPSSGGSPQLVLGLGLLAVGLVGLSAGVLVVATRRRRGLAESERG